MDLLTGIYKQAISTFSGASPLHCPAWFLPFSFRVDYPA